MMKMIKWLAILLPSLCWGQTYYNQTDVISNNTIALTNKTIDCNSNTCENIPPTSTTAPSLFPVFDVLAYGAKCNHTGDDSTAINSAFAAARTAANGGQQAVKVLFPPQQECLIHGPLNFTGFGNSTGNQIIVEGQGSTILANSSYTGPIIDMLGTSGMTIRDITVVAYLGTQTYGIQGGRYNTASAGDNIFLNVQAVGKFTNGACYFNASEVNTYINLVCKNSTTSGSVFGLILDAANHWNITSSFVTVTAPVDTITSMANNVFVGPNFSSYSASGAPLWEEGAGQTTFINCYMQNASAGGYGIFLYSTADVSPYETNRLQNFDCHIEGSTQTSLGYAFWITGPGTGGPNFSATPNIRSLSYNDLDSWADTAVFGIDSGANITTATLSNLHLNITRSRNSPPIFDTAANYSVSANDIYLGDSAMWNGLTTWQTRVNSAGTITARANTLASTVSTGTAPLVVASTTNVANLNASSLNGATFASPGAIGSGSASTGAFTTLSASSTVSGTGFSTYLASPPAIGGSAAAAGSFTTLTANGYNTEETLLQTAIPFVLGPSAFYAANGVVIIGQTVGSSATLTFGATSGSTTATFSAGTPFTSSDAGDVNRVITVYDSAVAVTCTSAAPMVCTGDTVPNGTMLILGGTTVPTGFTAGTLYYVVATSGNTFELAATIGGSAITSTSAGSSVTASSYKFCTVTAHSSSTVATCTISGGTLSKTGTFANATAYLSGTYATTNAAGTDGVTHSSPLPRAMGNSYSYFPADSVTASNSAGWYWTYWLATTLGVAYNTTYTTGLPTVQASPTAFAVGGNGAVAQTSASYLQSVAFSLPGNSMGANGELDWWWAMSCNNTAGNHVTAAYFAGTKVSSTNPGSGNITGGGFGFLTNRAATNSQIANVGSGTTGSLTVSSVAMQTFAIDTTSSQTIAFYQNLNSAATDVNVLEQYSMKLYPN